MPRFRSQPRPSWRPISSMRWRKHMAGYGEAKSGTRYFLFGIIPITTIWDQSKGSI
jgi:hypothetical protein